MSDDPKTIDLTYAGRRLSTKDTLIYAWIDGEGEERLYKRTLATYAGIGTTFRFKIADNGESIVLGGERVGRIEDDSQRLAWEAADTDAALEHAKITQRKREKDNTLLREHMLPIRVAMDKNTGVRRSAFAAAVLHELHRPLTKAEREEPS